MEKVFIKKSILRKFQFQDLKEQKKILKKGEGVGLGKMMGRGTTNYEFSTSNPMWRATLDILDFLPLTTVGLLRWHNYF